MLDRRTIKEDVKNNRREARGTVFLATLLVFIICIVYIGAVWLIAQYFFPITRDGFDVIKTWYEQQQVTLSPDVSQLQGTFSSIGQLFGSMPIVWRNLLFISLTAFVLELILILPLIIGFQRFMLHIVRYADTRASAVFRGYSGSCFFRAILLPFWEALCKFAWQLIMSVLLCGILAAIALVTGYSSQTLTSAIANGVTAENLAALLPAEYAAKYGTIYLIAIGVWTVLYIWLMIYKDISYSMSGMALAQRPQIGVRKALRASRKITRGNHWALFVVSLSFIGWYLLAGLAFAMVGGIAAALQALKLGQLGLIISLGLLVVVTLLVMYLLMPYRVGVHARCYLALKREARDAGIIVRSDFRGKRELRQGAAGDVVE